MNSYINSRIMLIRLSDELQHSKYQDALSVKAGNLCQGSTLINIYLIQRKYWELLHTCCYGKDFLEICFKLSRTDHFVYNKSLIIL